MGSPRRLRKKVVGPRHPFNAEQIEAEMRIAGEYGLRNKKEIWKLRTVLRRYRQRARQMLALSPEDRSKEESILLNKLTKLAVIPPNATLDHVLALQDSNFLDRRLQTVVYKLGLASTIHQARQFIVHGHISLRGKRVTAPNYHVKLGEEERITYKQSSPLFNESHPIRRVISELGPGLGPSGKTIYDSGAGDDFEEGVDADLDTEAEELDDEKE